jgi:hypothetical protein
VQSFWIGAVKRVKNIKDKGASMITSFTSLPGMSAQNQEGGATT